jgi:hypothetical protein
VKCFPAALAATVLIAVLPAMAQVIPGYPIGAPPVFVQGASTPATLRNAVQDTSDQARWTMRAAADMGRRAYTASFQLQNVLADFQNLQGEFQNLRGSFNLAAQIASGLQSTRAANAAAELDAGLNIISEAFGPVQQEIQTGSVNRDTVASMCRVLQEALQLWQAELKRKSSRLGAIR